MAKLAIQIDKGSGIPVYLQLEERLRNLVRRGALAPGAGLPTVRELAVELGVNANTVSRVYRRLQSDGVLVLERGVGTFVAPEGAGAGGAMPKRDFDRLAKRAKELIRLAKGAGMGSTETSQLIETLWKEVDDVSR
ncbi:MAG: GntR family transcriptional regulator [Planctomycetota bacterium]